MVSASEYLLLNICFFKWWATVIYFTAQRKSKECTKSCLPVSLVHLCYFVVLWNPKHCRHSVKSWWFLGFVWDCQELPWCRTLLHMVQSVKSNCFSCSLYHLFDPCRPMGSWQTGRRPGRSWCPFIFLSFQPSEQKSAWTLDFLLKYFDCDPCLADIFVLNAKVGICMWENLFPGPAVSECISHGREMWLWTSPWNFSTALFIFFLVIFYIC